MKNIEYLFYEWLIVKKNLNKDKFEKLTPKEFESLKKEFIRFYNDEII